MCETTYRIFGLNIQLDLLNGKHESNKSVFVVIPLSIANISRKEKGYPAVGMYIR